MPFVSNSQRRWGNSPAGVKALGGKAKVAEWNQATKGKNLPDRKKGSVVKELGRRLAKRDR